MVHGPELRTMVLSFVSDQNSRGGPKQLGVRFNLQKHIIEGHTWARLTQVHNHGWHVEAKETTSCWRGKALWKKIISPFHDSLMGGNSGVTATLQRIVTLLYWKWLKRYVRKFVLNCDASQRYKIWSIDITRAVTNPFPYHKQIL